MEAFTLKTGAEATRQAWLRGSEAQRRALLSGPLAEVMPGSADLTRMAGAPMDIGTIEWFASAEDLVRVMDWFRRHGDAQSREILGINAGLPSNSAGHAYVGFKGGSEPGVINLTYLIRNRDGVWHVATGSWNNPSAAVEEARFAGLMARAVQLVR
jgi:hypothetical protein